MRYNFVSIVPFISTCFYRSPMYKSIETPTFSNNLYTICKDLMLLNHFDSLSFDVHQFATWNVHLCLRLSKYTMSLQFLVFQKLQTVFFVFMFITHSRRYTISWLKNSYETGPEKKIILMNT